jgi:hypothetical protein
MGECSYRHSYHVSGDGHCGRYRMARVRKQAL